MSSSAQQQGYGSIPSPPPPEEDPRKWRQLSERVTSPRGILFGLFGGGLFFLLWLAYSDRHHDVRAGGTASSTTLQTRVTNGEERFYREQLVDHFGQDPEGSNYYNEKATYAQRYFEDKTYFQGPGHPIFVVMGGEAPIDDGIIYPWVNRALAKTFGALTVCVEHRFYGASQPVDPAIVTNADFRQLLHPRQALTDAAYFIQHLQQSLGCGPRGSGTYCPVVTIGGSYPGFLAVLMRTVHKAVVDIGWGSSAPLHLYSHAASDAAYYDKITSVAEAFSPGCQVAVKKTLHAIQTTVDNDVDKTLSQVAADMGICQETIPRYIRDTDTLQQEVIMITAARFADTNMGFYPPTPDQPFVQGCQIFERQDLTPHEKVSAFLRMPKDFEECFDMVSELPIGSGATISGSDWSGVGGGHAGYIWDYQSCTLIPECSLSPESMFPPREWTLEWLTEHCQRRFGYTPRPPALVEEFGFEDLSQDSHIIFTNGFNDGWYALSVTEDVSDTIRVFNFPNGSHHSDLTHNGATDQDTPDIVQGHKDVTALMQTWIGDIMGA